MERGVSIPGLSALQFLPNLQGLYLQHLRTTWQEMSLSATFQMESGCRDQGAGHKERVRSSALLVKAASVAPPLHSSGL